jgi:hypothetical protein
MPAYCAWFVQPAEDELVRRKCAEAEPLLLADYEGIQMLLEPFGRTPEAL